MCLKSVLIASTIVLAMPLAVHARPEQPAKATLTIGDAAPPLTIEKWVRGESIASFAKGKVYVVEFWATWCGPCVRAIPHLTELQKKHGGAGLTVIGVTRPDAKGNTLEKVEEMVRKKNAENLMTYTVAWDGSKKTSEAYMEASGQQGIPCSFVVDREGRIAFIGHPMALDDVIPPVLAGSWDIQKAKAEYEEARAAEGRRDEFMVAMRTKQYDKAYAIGRELVETYAKDDAGTLNLVAWMIVDPDSEVSNRDLGLALKAAERACELTKFSEPGILDTLARVYAWKGDFKKAIDLQEKAVGLVEGESREELQKALDEYREKAKK